MTSIRFHSIAAVALAIGLGAPANAAWWPIATTASTTAPATTSPPSAAPQQRTAATSTAVPEPADFALFAAGVVGLLLGRRGSRSRRD